jgi:glycosyltransferase involved in cell wall biosynthesis
MTDRRILIYEPEAGGHQMNFVRYVVTAIRDSGLAFHVTLLSTADAVEHPQARALLDEFAGSISLVLTPLVTRGNRLFRALDPFYERQWRYAEALSSAMDQLNLAEVDFIFLPSLETIGLLHLFLKPNLFRGKPWATIANAIRFHHRSQGIEGPTRAVDTFQRLCFWRVIGYRDLVCFGAVDPYLSAAMANPKVVYCPDPCDPPKLSPPETARAFYHIRPETIVILVFGFIDRRKSVDVLLDGAARVADDADLTVLLAGAQHPGHLQPVLSGAAARSLRDRGRLIEINRFIDFEAEIDPMSVADIVWVFYEKDFVRNSNVLGHAGLARRPVIARHQGIVGRLVQQHKLGLALSSDAPDAVAAALTTLARDPTLRHEMGENGARAFAHNTPENFARPIVDAINRAVAREA